MEEHVHEEKKPNKSPFYYRSNNQPELRRFPKYSSHLATIYV